nr:MAG TPA: hypothetical protein [Bacteriophage sp.]
MCCWKRKVVFNVLISCAMNSSSSVEKLRDFTNMFP